MPDFPKITIVTPSFNQASFLAEALASVHAQDYPNFEHIVIDGGSSDGSVDVIRRFEDRLAYWVSESDRGQSHAINKGFDRATGDILCWLNSDDLLEPGALSRVARLLGKHVEPAWLIGASRLIDETGRTRQVRTPGQVSFMSFLRWTVDWFPQQSTFWNRAMWQATCRVREDLTYTMDMALWHDMLVKAEPQVSTEVLAAYRIHEQAKCVSSSDLARQEQSLLVREWLLAQLQDAYDKGDANSEALSLVEKLVEDYTELHETLALSEARLARVRGHPVIGRFIRAWRALVNPGFDI